MIDLRYILMMHARKQIDVHRVGKCVFVLAEEQLGLCELVISKYLHIFMCVHMY
jgi:hypothetical protein